MPDAPEPEREEPDAGLSQEVAAFDALAAAPTTAVTTKVLGVAPLSLRAPSEYWPLFERYARVLDHSLDRHTYRDPAAGASEELRAIAEGLGALEAGAREIADLHARALRQKTRTATFHKAEAYTAEGRLIAFELMGHLVSYYRRRASVNSRGDRG